MSESDKKIELISKAFALKNQKKYQEAIDTMRSALEINVNTHQNAEIHSQLGELYILMNDLASALNEFQKA